MMTLYKLSYQNNEKVHMASITVILHIIKDVLASKVRKENDFEGELLGRKRLKILFLL